MKGNLMPMDKSRYPENWPDIRAAVMARAGELRYGIDNELIGQPACCELCGAVNHKPHPITGSEVVLTVAHMDDEMDDHGRYIWNELIDLLALCQRCHNKIDAPKRRHRRMKSGR